MNDQDGHNSNHEETSRKLTRRQILKLGGGLMLTSLAGPVVAACGNIQVQSANGTVVSTGKKTNPNAPTVTFWTSMSDIYLQALQHMTQDFNKKNPDVYVNLVQVPPEVTAGAVTKLLTAVRGGTGPDAYMIDRFTMPQYAAIGLLEDLTDRAHKVDKNYGDRYLDFAWKEATYNNKIWGLPADTDARCLYYRTDILEKSGVDPNVMKHENGPVTIDQIREIAKKVDQTGPRGDYTRLGFIPWFGQGFLFYTWGFNFNGDFFSQQNCRVTPTNEGVIQGYKLGYDWAKRYGAQKVQSFLASYNRPNAPPQQSPFITDRLAMYISGDWDLANFKEYAPKMPYDLTYIPVPKKGDKPSTWSGGFAYVVPTNAKHPDGAWKFLQYMSGPEGQRTYTVETAHMPTLKSLLKEKSLYKGKHEFFVNKLLPISRSRPPLPVGALYWNELLTAQDAVTLLDSTPIDATKNVGSRVNPRLQLYCPIRS